MLVMESDIQRNMTAVLDLSCILKQLNSLFQFTGRFDMLLSRFLNQHSKKTKEE